MMVSQEQWERALLPSDPVKARHLKAVQDLQHKKDEIVRGAVERILGRSPSDIEILERGSRNIDTFGNETIYWDGNIIVAFPKTQQGAEVFSELTTIRLEQPYKLYV